MRKELHMNRQWILILILILLTALGLLTGKIHAASDSTTECELVMGWEPWEPYQYLDNNNQLVGFDIDLITTITSGMGCTLKFKELVWARGLVVIESCIIDMLAHADYTDERNT